METKKYNNQTLSFYLKTSLFMITKVKDYSMNQIYD